MELIDIIHALRDFYLKKFDKPPYEITMGRYWYEQARMKGIVEMPPSYQRGNGSIAGMKIDVDPRDDYKLAVEDYRRYQDRAQYRFDMR